MEHPVDEEVEARVIHRLKKGMDSDALYFVEHE
jgi:hypothetical protein